MGGGLTREAEAACQVHGENALEIGVLPVLQCATMLNAGVVDENVEASTFRSDVRDRAAGGVCVSDIEGQCDDVIALPVNRPIASLRPGRGRALTATVAPRAASASDIAKPSPREAPVTIATRSTREKGSSIAEIFHRTSSPALRPRGCPCESGEAHPRQDDRSDPRGETGNRIPDRGGTLFDFLTAGYDEWEDEALEVASVAEGEGAIVRSGNLALLDTLSQLASLSSNSDLSTCIYKIYDRILRE